MHSTANEIPLAEREGELWKASRQYMSGEISLEKLEAVERNYALPSDLAVTRSKVLLEKQLLKKYSPLAIFYKLWQRLWRRL